MISGLAEHAIHSPKANSDIDASKIRAKVISFFRFIHTG